MSDASKLFEQLLNDSNQMIQVSDIDTYTMMYVNDTAREYTGHADQPFEGRHCYEYMMGLNEQCSFCPMRQIKDKSSFETEVDNGKEIFAVKTKKVKWDGKDAFVEYAWDVTNIRRSEKIYENQIQMIVSAISEAQGVFHMDVTDNTILSINGSSKEVLNMNNLETVDDLINMITSYIPNGTEHNEFFQAFCRKTLIHNYEIGKTEFSKETFSYFDDKSIRPARITCRLLVNPSNNHLECIIYGIDISVEWNEREKYEKKVSEQLAVFDVLARNFKNVYLVNLKNDTAKILKFEDENSGHDFDELKGQIFPYVEFLNLWISRSVHSEDREYLKYELSPEHLREIFSKKSEYIGNYRVIVNNKVVNYQFNLSQLRKDGYIIAGFQNIDSIIQEHLEDEKRQKEVEEAYQAELEEQVSVFDTLARNFLNVFWINLQDGTAKVLKLDGYITKGLDKNNHQFFPYPVILKRYISERVHPDEKESLYQMICMDHLREVFTTQDEYVGNYRILVDGEVHNFQYNFSKMNDKDYIICGFQNVDSIIEEHLIEERKEREKEEAYQKQLEEQLSIFNNLSRNFRNVYLANLNTGIARILKIADDYDSSEIRNLVGKTFPYDLVLQHWISERVHPDDKERISNALNSKNAKKVLKTQDELVGNYKSYDNKIMHNYQYSLSKIDDSGTVIIGFQIIDDIIEEHLKEEKKQREKEEAYQKELIELNKQANKANAAKTEFLLRMSHDIRTPLNGIVGMLDIADRFPDDIEKQADCREKIKESSKILLELVNEVLDMSKLESGEIVLEEIPFDLSEVSKDVYTVIKKQADENGIEILQDSCASPNYQLIGSPIHLKRLMMNIVGNAIKYNKEHGKIYITCKELRHEGDLSYIQFKCRDTGIGMNKEFLKHIFEPFAQESITPRSKYGGTGLGMAITKSLVDKMGGTLEVESEKGVGSTFDVVIPFKIAKVSEPIVKNDEYDCDFSIKGCKILLAEDNELNMEIAKFLLQEEGAIVTEAWNGREAVDLYASSKPYTFDIILMDVMMPVMDGYQATKAIRSLNREDAAKIPIIAMTANAFAEDKIAAKEAGMNEHISKPLDTKLLIRTIGKLVIKK